jgi:hypothetical protein
MPTITVKDATLQGTQPAWEFALNKQQTTLRELIRGRIYQEVREYNAKKRHSLHCLISPTPACQEASELAAMVDWQAQYERAITAFEKRSYIIIADGLQITQLDTPLQTPKTITFLRLIPLIGG